VPSETPQISCRRFVKYLSACYDGELEEGVRVSLEAHRVGCAQCAQYATGFEAAITLTKNALAGSAAYAELPEDLTQAILTACRETSQRMFFKTRRR
jgi:anti-sigma factor RsiW